MENWRWTFVRKKKPGIIVWAAHWADFEVHQNWARNKSPPRTMQDVVNVMGSTGWGQFIKDRFQIEFLLVWTLSLILQGARDMLLDLLSKVEVLKHTQSGNCFGIHRGSLSVTLLAIQTTFPLTRCAPIRWEPGPSAWVKVQVHVGNRYCNYYRCSAIDRTNPETY